MSIFGTYMAKYCDTRQHQSSHLSHMWEGPREMYNKVKVDSQVPRLEKVLEEAWLKQVDLAQEHATWPPRSMVVDG